MEAFKPFVVISQDLTGKNLTITDQSNFATNTDGVNVGDISAFGVSILDMDGNLLNSQNLNYPTGAYVITKDMFLRFHQAYIDGDTTYQSDVTFLSTQFYDNLQRMVAAKLRCDCGCADLLTAASSRARECVTSAESALIAGDYVNAQLSMDDANTFIKEALKLC